jgi:2-polyprenyl-3-methyl-5-hydroxy-6-metoxy-1,4-benzoquinol methylase
VTSAPASEPGRSKAEKFWDRLAGAWSQPTEESGQTDTKVLVKTRPYLRDTDTVLDYGCAKGSVDLRLAAAVKAIHGIDLECQSFDVVLAFAIFHLLEDAPQALLRIGALLKPGGLLISVTPCLGEKGTLPVRFVMLLVRLATRLGVVPRVWRCSIGELQESMEAAGLAAIEIEELVHSTSEYFVVARKTR